MLLCLKVELLSLQAKQKEAHFVADFDLCYVTNSNLLETHQAPLYFLSLKKAFRRGLKTLTNLSGQFARWWGAGSSQSWKKAQGRRQHFFVFIFPGRKEIKSPYIKKGLRNTACTIEEVQKHLSIRKDIKVQKRKYITIKFQTFDPSSGTEWKEPNFFPCIKISINLYSMGHHM